MATNKEEAIKESKKILMEHFDSFCINLKIKDENLRTKIWHEWHGDITDVLGLNRTACARIEHRLAKDVENW